MIWRCRNIEFDLSDAIVMGILNLTPDSFSDGGEYFDLTKAYSHAHRMLEEGASIIDIGGESTRPGSNELDEDTELGRVLPLVKALCEEGLVISIDTRHPKVAAACIDAGAAIVNDVSGYRDPRMREVAGKSDVGCVVMHMLGEPQSMQVDPHYDDVVGEVKDYLLGQAALLQSAGVAPDRICIDPGPGFGKDFSHNLALLQATSELAALPYPLMAAYSRKGFIGKMTGITEAADRAATSAIVAAWAAKQGARVLRVHDVRATVEALKVFRYL
ncbi:MAG: dihydropteroate synthase [Coriobacteriia bacterium]|nr:dihydropteroate synthase [Coriobacteriia bacterium]